MLSLNTKGVGDVVSVVLKFAAPDVDEPRTFDDAHLLKFFGSVHNSSMPTFRVNLVYSGQSSQ